jgi:hypothetical protein
MASSIEARQVAVAELAPRTDLRDELAVVAREAVARTIDLDAFFEWAEFSRSRVASSSLASPNSRTARSSSSGPLASASANLPASASSSISAAVSDHED